MKFPRMTIRRAMIALAILAVPLSFLSGEMLSRRETYLGDTAYHARREAEERRNLTGFGLARHAGTADANSSSIVKMERASRLRVTYHADLKRKYQKAAAYPWVSVPPDPRDPGESLLWESLNSGPLTSEFRLSSEDLKGLSLSR